MCGILGYKGKRNASEILLNGIRNLEYRGYDSVGMVTINNGLLVKKDSGKVDEVNNKVNFLELKGHMGMAHTRWSTHGAPTKANAHPHLSSDGNIAVVHNGIIENYAELKRELEIEGWKFKSETDTEVIPFLIEKYARRLGFEKGVRDALRRLEGTFAVVVLNKDSDKMIAARRMSPLVIGVGKGEWFLASDIPAFIEYTRDAIFVEDNEMVIVDKSAEISNFVTGDKVNRMIKRIDWSLEQVQKGEYEHFMIKEIHEQPRAIEDTFRERIEGSEVIFEELDNEQMKKVKRIVMVACGTSWHACLAGKFMIESLGKIPVEVDYASEFRYRNPIISENDLLIAVSQSGETADTLAAIKEAKSKGSKVLSVCNVVGSSIARKSDNVIYTRAGPEIGVASTKSFVTQVTVLYLFGVYLAQLRRTWPKEHLAERIESLKGIPRQIKMILDEKEKVMECAKNNYFRQNALFLGRGTNYPIALEGALKLKEVSYIHAEGYPAAEMKHGPIALIDNQMPVFVIAVRDSTYEKIKGNIEEIKARGGIVTAISTNDDEEIKAMCSYMISVPKTSGLLYPLLTVVPLQLLAYYIAKYRGCDIDKPKNLAKAVTVE